MFLFTKKLDEERQKSVFEDQIDSNLLPKFSDQEAERLKKYISM